MKLLKTSIIIVIISIVIITMLLLLIIENGKGAINDEVGHIDFNQLDIVTDRIEYFRIRAIFDRYNNAINNLEENDEEKNSLMNLIDDECRQFLKLNSKNIYEKINRYKNEIYSIENIYYVEKNINTRLYYISGTLNNVEELKLIVKVDLYTETFSIFTQQYVEEKEYNERSINDYFEIEGIEYIEVNEDNKYSDINITDKLIAQYYIDDYSNKVINDINNAYKTLDEKYKEIRFSTLEQYVKYIQESNKEYNSIIVKECKMKEYDNYIEITCKDQYGNTYIFKDTGIMQYTVQLDNYTISNTATNNEYSYKTNLEKVETNILKIFEMINMNDYTTIYKYLEKMFKYNNFDTLDKFENYAKETFFDYNVLGNITIQEQGKNYVITVPYKDGNSSIAEKRKMKFVMRLQENTDFIISFEK